MSYPAYYPARRKFFVSRVGPSPCLWCAQCSLYFPIPADDDDDEQREAKAAHECNRRVAGWQ